MLRKKALFLLLLIGLCNINHSFSQNIQWISYSPAYPGLEDTITVHVAVEYNNTGCNPDSLSVEQLWSHQYLAKSYTCCIPGISALFTVVDSFNIFPDLPYAGFVDVYFMVGYLTNSQCPAFPILVGGDTISYPTEIDFIEIPVGYAAGETEKTMNEMQFNIFPNPSNSITNIQFNTDGNVELFVDVINTQGQIVKSIPGSYYKNGLNTIQLDVYDLVDGIYILQIRTDKEQYQFSKLVKAH